MPFPTTADRGSTADVAAEADEPDRGLDAPLKAVGVGVGVFVEAEDGRGGGFGGLGDGWSGCLGLGDRRRDQ